MKTIHIFYGLLITALLSACSSNTAGNAKQAETPQKTETFKLKKDRFSTSIQLPGEISAYRQVDIYAKVPSFVKELNADLGTEVKAGDLLVQLEAPELSSQLLAAESRLKSLEATYTASQANYNRLVETGKTPGTVSQNDLDLAQARKNSDQANLEAARASYKEIGVLKSYLEIRAPFSGIITARNVNLGAYVGPNGKGSELPLFTLQEQKQLRLAVAVPESYAGFLSIGTEMGFYVKALPAERFKATIRRMAGALDLRLRSEKVEMDLDNSSKQLLPGMVAEVSLPLIAKDSSFTVPKTALVSSNEGLFLIKVVNNKVQRVPVKKGRDIQDKVEVFGELQLNEEFVVKGSEELRDGNPVIR